MRSQALRRTAATLVLTAAMLTVSGLTATGQDNTAKSEEVLLTMYVFNRAGVEQERLLEAERVVQRIYEKAGVQLRPVDVYEMQRGGKEIRLGPGDIQLNILSERMTALLRLRGDLMGMTPGKGPDRWVVYVFYGAVQAQARAQMDAAATGNVQWAASATDILGHAMAHEIGHVLNQAHSRSGIMRAQWNRADLLTIAYGSMLFTPQQVRAIRAEVVRRNSLCAVPAEESLPGGVTP